MEFKKPKDNLPFPSPCPHLPAFQQDPQHEMLAFGVWIVGHKAGRAGSSLDTQALASTCLCMNSKEIKRSAWPRPCLSPRARRGTCSSGAEGATNAQQTPPTRCRRAPHPPGPRVPGRADSPPTRQTWLVQGAGTGAKCIPQPDLRAGPPRPRSRHRIDIK